MIFQIINVQVFLFKILFQTLKNVMVAALLTISVNYNIEGRSYKKRRHSTLNSTLKLRIYFIESGLCFGFEYMSLHVCDFMLIY